MAPSRKGSITPEAWRGRARDEGIMIVGWNWLKEYVRLDMSVDVLTDRLMMAGLNLEEVADVEGDMAIDLEVTSNRPDCLSHIGVARETCVLFDRDLQIPAAAPAEKGPPVASVT